MPVAERRHDYDVNEVAALTNTSVATIYRKIRDKEIPAYKVGSMLRVRAEDVERLRDGGATPAQLPPWLAELSPESRAAIADIVAASPELTDRQRERLRLLFRPKRTHGGGPHSK